MICFLTTNYLHPYEIYYLITACITQNRTWGIWGLRATHSLL